MRLIIELSDETYDKVINPNNWYNPNSAINDIIKALINGTPLPKGHGRLFDERDIVNSNYEVIGNRIYELEPIIEADRESEVDNGNNN